MRWRLILFLPLVAFLASPAQGAQEIDDDEIKIIHINIGQGDATLILGPVENGKRVSVLVDAGNITSGGKPDGGLRTFAVLLKNGVKHNLDFFIASHYDADHIGGVAYGSASVHGTSFALGPNGVPGGEGDDDNDGNANWLPTQPDGVLVPDPEELGKDDDILVGKFIDRGDASKPTSQTYRKYKALASARPGTRQSLTDQAAVDGLEIPLGKGAKMICMAANGFVRGRAQKVANVNTENERSLAFLLEYGDFHYFIGGDLIGRQYGQENAKVEKAVGEAIAAMLNGDRVDVLRTNHHGANNTSEKEFLDLISPQVAIVSCGDGNAHGHPHVDHLKRLADAGTLHTYQTERGTTRHDIPINVQRALTVAHGDIIVTSAGKAFDVYTKRWFWAGDEP